MAMLWKKVHPHARQYHLGFIPSFLDDADPRGAREQIAENYAHGGGWSPFPGFEMLSNGNLQYPGVSPTRLLWELKFRDETVRVYESTWVAVIQADGTWEVNRLD